MNIDKHIVTSEWWREMSDEQMLEANPHLKHLIGKTIDELHKMYPDAKVCYSRSCQMTDLDHGIFMEYEQDTKDGKNKLVELK